MSPAPPDDPWAADVAESDADIIDLPHVEMLEITELSPVEHKYAGKRIETDNRITPYPSVTDWRQAVSRCPATIMALYHYLREARARNIILIRGTPVDLSRPVTRRKKQFFADEPSRLLFFDIDGAPFAWREDPEAALHQIVAEMGEPWASASFVWLYSGGHGLGTETFQGKKRWIGSIVDGKMRVRLAFILDRPIDEAEAVALTAIAQARAGFVIDNSVARTVQPNYIRRIYWAGHAGEDPLGDIETIGWVKGAREFATVPADLTHKARWAHAQGHGSDIADHPSALSAVLAISSDGRIRQHLKSAIVHLFRANPAPALVSLPAHAATLARKLEQMVRENEAAIGANLAKHRRQWGDVTGHLAGMSAWALWVLENFDASGPISAPRRTIRLAREARAKQHAPSKQEVRSRVLRVIKDAVSGVTLLIAPPGSGKSTQIRAEAVAYVRAHPDETVVILVPRAQLGDEQVEALYREHPEGDFVARVWRGRHQEDPEFIGPQRLGEERKKMCRRDAEVAEAEKKKISISEHFCHRGRGAMKVCCPFLPLCGHQGQQAKTANIWFAAHEMMAFDMPATFGTVGRIYIDEDPTDALMFGTDLDHPYKLDLETLKAPPSFLFVGRDLMMEARFALYRVLERLTVPDDPHRGTPVGREHLQDFFPDPNSPFGMPRYNPSQMAALEWVDKAKPGIRPDMPARQVRKLLKQTKGNGIIERLATLWTLIGAGGGGRIQIHRSDRGRVIRMVGLRPIAKDWRNIPTLICDGTGDATLLRAIWPNLKCEGEDDWRQLPRPDSVRIFQCVDKALSKTMIAIEGEDEKLETRERAARRLWAAVMARALEYGGQDVGVILYKSTKEWILENENCFKPDWIKLGHHGAVTGSNGLEKVRALFDIGRTLVPAEAVTRQTEALFGDYIAEREYRVSIEGGRIPIAEDAAGNNVILVDVREHPDPRAERVRRQGTEGQSIQAAERARPGLRGAPLDIHLWTNVALPELGEVEPELWSEQDDGLDAVMLATGGVWLKNISHAAKAYGEFFAANTLKKARQRARDQGVGTFPIGTHYRQCTHSSLFLHFRYQLAGDGQKPTEGASLRGLDETKAWLEERLGALARFEEVRGQPAAAAAE